MSPMYNYTCFNPECKKKSERIVSFNEADNQTCDICGSKLIRGISAPHFKLGESFVKGMEPDNYSKEDGKPYKGFYYDDEYVAKQEEQEAKSGIESPL